MLREGVIAGPEVREWQQLTTRSWSSTIAQRTSNMRLGPRNCSARLFTGGTLAWRWAPLRPMPCSSRSSKLTQLKLNSLTLLVKRFRRHHDNLWLQAAYTWAHKTRFIWAISVRLTSYGYKIWANLGYFICSCKTGFRFFFPGMAALVECIKT